VKIVTIDFETYFDKDYSLSKLTTEEYVRDKRFEIHGCTIRHSDGRYEWTRDPYRELCNLFDHAFLAHHAQFDGFILTHHYGLRPLVWLDTLSMARLVLGNHLSVGLGALAEHFGLASKSVPYNDFKGLHWAELSYPVQGALMQGGRHDVELTWAIYNKLLPSVPNEELQLIDLTIKMFTDPKLEGDLDLLGKVWAAEHRKKYELLDALGVTASDLQSSGKFAELLRAEGVEPPTKPGKNGPIYCFAKTDKFMKEELLEHPDDRVRMLGEARLGVRSTLEQTRAARLGHMATRGTMPVYLAYCGAHTTRWSGGDGCLAGSTRVTVFDFQKGVCDKCIIEVLPDDLIWDGEAFVAHEGVVFQGYREVITYAGITGTRDHRVFTTSGVTTLGDAAARGLQLERPRKPARQQIHEARKTILQVGFGSQATLHESKQPKLEQVRKTRNQV
jgi:hypothetical protein